jgi:Ni,Fe-hydrogenase III large subunit
LGPYHPALLQPLALTFKLRGETVVHADPPGHGYCHRGVEALASGKPVSQTLDIVERSCSFAGHSHRVAVCQAIEAATASTPSARADLVRGLLAEIERALARLWTLGITARAAGLHVLLRDALAHREGLFDALERATGQRSFWGIAEPGGVREVDAAGLEALADAVEQLTGALGTWRISASPRGPLGRAGTGVGKITEERARALQLTGLAARAGGIASDLRRDAPYGAYANIDCAWDADAPATRDGSDVAARMALAISDLAVSLRLARTMIDALPAADDTSVVARSGARSRARNGHGRVEGPHGAVEADVAMASGDVVDSVRLQVPGGALLASLPELLDGQPIALVPLILASLDLCMECADL